MGRMIDADVAEKLLREYADDVGCNRGEYELANGMLKAVSYIRHNIPTAYDVEKVVEELEKKKNEYLEGFRTHDNDEMYGVACGFGDSIKIVRRGGVE